MTSQYNIPDFDESKEEWKDVPGCAGYRASNFGRIKGKRTNDPLCPILSRGYYSIHVSFGKTAYLVRIHKMVALAFIGPRPAKHQVNHLNGIKTDNRAINLEWATASRNIRHAFEMGLAPSGEDHYRRRNREFYKHALDGVRPKGSQVGTSKLNESKVAEIKLKLSQGRTKASLGREYNVSESAIADIEKGRRWKHVH